MGQGFSLDSENLNTLYKRQGFSLDSENLNTLYKNRFGSATIRQDEWKITVSKLNTIGKKLHCLLVVTKGETTKTYRFAILVSPDNDKNNKYNMKKYIETLIRGFDKTPGLSAKDIKELCKSVTTLKL